MTDFARLLVTLGAHQVDFIVIGGAAAIAHGTSRFTQDLDIVYDRSSENLQRIVAALNEFRPYLRGAPPGLPFQWDRAALSRGLYFPLTTSIGDLDLFGEIPGGGTYNDLAGQAIELQLFGTRVLCLSLTQLIHAKRATGRPKDLEALAELEAISEQDQH